MSLAAEMTRAGQDWLAALTSQQRDRARYPEIDGERTRWFYTPTDHGGLPLNQQRPRQQGLAMRLVATGLSPAGYATVTTVMGLENVLDRDESWSRDFGRERGRDPGLYYLSVFGTPGDGAWGWRFGGHHVSLNYTLNGERLISCTPCFLGANPARTTLLAGETLQPLGGIEATARDLARSVAERGQLHPVAIPDIVSGNRDRVRDGDELPRWQYLWRDGQADTPPADRGGYGPEGHRALALTTRPKGISGTTLTPDERALLVRLAAGYLERFPAEFGDPWLDRYRASLGDLHFGYAGQPDGGPFYYRLQDQRLLVEYDNTQQHANHAHSVVRDLHGDFGLNA